MPQVVLDHHETGGVLSGVLFSDIRTHLGATSTMITGYLLEQRVIVDPPLATALLYGIESETMGYPREACSLDDGALIWLYPRADKDLLARIRNPKLPQSHFATFHSCARQRIPLRQADLRLVRHGDPAGHHRGDRRFLHPFRSGRLVAVRGRVRPSDQALAPGRPARRAGGRGPPGRRQRDGECRRSRQAGRRGRSRCPISRSRRSSRP